jgi:hypothetical protein
MKMQFIPWRYRLIALVVVLVGVVMALYVNAIVGVVALIVVLYIGYRGMLSVQE